MREYSAEKYVQATEENPDPILSEHMQAELEIIKSVVDSQDKDFVDLGAGHGRIIQTLASVARQVYAIEINPQMIPELERRAKEFTNVEIIQGDFQRLSDLLAGLDIQKPVLVLVQNSLGTIEGSEKLVLESMKEFAEQNNGEVILSLFRADALKDWGIPLYSGISYMVGEPDLEKTDFEKGMFVSKTGYTSKWRTDEDIEEIKQHFAAEMVRQIKTPHYIILHLRNIGSLK